jgi:hypothetical protein
MTTPESAQNIGFVLIVVGSIFSFGRDYLSNLYVRLHAWLKKRPLNEKLVPAVRLYLMMTGSVFILAGVLKLLGIFR